MQMKLHLTKCIKNERLYYHEFQTVLSQIEAALNSRPLYELSTDADSEEVITPSHLLYGYAINALPEPDITDADSTHLQRYSRTIQLYQKFWKKWSTDYLHKLQRRSKWTKSQANVKVGQLVLFKEDNLHPTRWLMGRITKLHPGSDNRVRAVELKHGTSTFLRPIAKLCPLAGNETLNGTDPSSAPPGTWSERSRSRDDATHGVATGHSD